MLRLSQSGRTLSAISHVEDFTKGYDNNDINNLIHAAAGYKCETVRIVDVAGQSDFLQKKGFAVTSDKSTNNAAIYEAPLHVLAKKVLDFNLYRAELYSRYGEIEDTYTNLILADNLHAAYIIAEERLNPLNGESVSVTQIS